MTNTDSVNKERRINDHDITMSDVSNDTDGVPSSFSPFELMLTPTETELSAHAVNTVVRLAQEIIEESLVEQYGYGRVRYVSMDELVVGDVEWIDGGNRVLYERRAESSPCSTIDVNRGSIYFHVPWGYDPPSTEQLNDIVCHATNSTHFAKVLRRSGHLELDNIQATHAYNLPTAKPTHPPTASPTTKSIKSTPQTSQPTAKLASPPSSSPTSTPATVIDNTKLASSSLISTSDHPTSLPQMPLIITSLSLTLISLICCLFYIHTRKQHSSQKNSQDKSQKLFAQDSLQNRNIFNFKLSSSKSFQSDDFSSCTKPPKIQISSTQSFQSDDTASTPTNCDDDFDLHHHPIILRKDLILQDSNVLQHASTTTDLRQEKTNALQKSHFHITSLDAVVTTNDEASMSDFSRFEQDESWDPDDNEVESAVSGEVFETSVYLSPGKEEMGVEGEDNDPSLRSIV